MRSILALIVCSIAGIILLTACNSAEQKGRTAAAPGANSGAPVYADGARRVTPNEVRDLLAKDQAVIIDVRNAEAYNTAHVHGARLIPEADLPSHLNELPKNKLIVTYCS